MSLHDGYADWDASYVLGALSPAERLEFEGHLAGCAACRSAVADLAGMPGLLAQLTPAEVLAMDHAGDDGQGDDLLAMTPPASLMPVLPVAAASSWRRRWLVPVAAAAAALLIGGIGGYAASTAGRDGGPGVRSTAGPTGSGGSSRPGSTRPVAAPARLAFSPVEPSLMTAVVDVVPVANGTELRVECQYAHATGAAGAGDYRVDYAIWVVDRSGRATELRDWTARPDRIMHPVGVSALPVAQIASVEIRQVDTGHTVMRASLA